MRAGIDLAFKSREPISPIGVVRLSLEHLRLCRGKHDIALRFFLLLDRDQIYYDS